MSRADRPLLTATSSTNGEKGCTTGILFLYVFDYIEDEGLGSSSRPSDDDVESICERTSRNLKSLLERGERRTVDKSPYSYYFFRPSREILLSCVALPSTRALHVYEALDTLNTDDVDVFGRKEAAQNLIDRHLAEFSSPESDVVTNCQESIKSTKVATIDRAMYQSFGVGSREQFTDAFQKTEDKAAALALLDDAMEYSATSGGGGINQGRGRFGGGAGGKRNKCWIIAGLVSLLLICLLVALITTIVVIVVEV